MMESSVVIIISVFIGCVMGIGSMTLGAYLFSRNATGGSVFSGTPAEPHGDAFTIDTDGDQSPFPDQGDKEMEANIMNKTNKFLEMFEGGK